MFETMSTPLLTNVITLLSVVLCLLCGLTVIGIFLYWLTKEVQQQFMEQQVVQEILSEEIGKGK